MRMRVVKWALRKIYGRRYELSQHDWYAKSRILLHSSSRENGKCTYT